MVTKKNIRPLLLAALLGVAPAAPQAQQRLADGNDWMDSSVEQRRAYMVGLSNVIGVGYQYDLKKLPQVDNTFMRRAYKGLSDTTILDAIDRIDAWYQAHPDQLDKSVIEVLWLEIAKPRLAATQQP